MLCRRKCFSKTYRFPNICFQFCPSCCPSSMLAPQFCTSICPLNFVPQFFPSILPSIVPSILPSKTLILPSILTSVCPSILTLNFLMATLNPYLFPNLSFLRAIEPQGRRRSDAALGPGVQALGRHGLGVWSLW